MKKKYVSSVKKALTALVAPVLMAGGCSTISAIDTMKFAAGGLTGLAIHEGSHYAVGEAFGMEPEFDIKDPTKVTLHNYRNQPKNEKILENGAGLIGQTIATEAILGSKNIDKSNPYVAGLLAFTIGDNIRYGAFPNLRGKEGSDVEHLSENGANKELVQGALLVHSAYALYRLFKDDKFSKEFKNKFNFSILPGKKGLEYSVSLKHKF